MVIQIDSRDTMIHPPSSSSTSTQIPRRPKTPRPDSPKTRAQDTIIRNYQENNRSSKKFASSNNRSCNPNVINEDSNEITNVYNNKKKNSTHRGSVQESKEMFNNLTNNNMENIHERRDGMFSSNHTQEENENSNLGPRIKARHSGNTLGGSNMRITMNPQDTLMTIFRKQIGTIFQTIQSVPSLIVGYIKRLLPSSFFSSNRDDTCQSSSGNQKRVSIDRPYIIDE